MTGGAVKRDPIPKFWAGDRVQYTNPECVSFAATVKKSETRWDRHRQPWVYYCIRLDNGQQMTGVFQDQLRGHNND